MYVPAAFAQTDLPTLYDFMERHSFALFVTDVGGAPYATHLPFLLDRSAGPQGTLVGHVARANPQWTEAAGQTALAIFSGPHAYVSPSWYEAENVVPTWNYIAVHVYGRVQVIEDADRLLAIVGTMVTEYEQALPHPWAVGDRNTFIDRMLSQIVGFRIEIERIEGKWKLNQNHPPDRREKVMCRLREIGGENAEGIARAMEDNRGR
ncbi:MAG: FMN-binding negative transcriptional regulator [Planctomycetia bacterium]|nr:FMN-binding negative transcriptional regulator [Planctomycetia bacterium]